MTLTEVIVIKKTPLLVSSAGFFYGSLERLPMTEVMASINTVLV
ncbi:MAG: hypothetical protein O3C29_14880 [Proteobacteria bacterium]|nr:hypothetical protein [Pseudomonadota bacterium]MDA1291855.1 hypothetical protein [Pseudomonadota bacterium]